MSTAKEYNILFRLNAQLDKAFSSTFEQAQKSFEKTKLKMQELRGQQADIYAYQQQQKAVEATSRKLEDLQKQHDNIQREISETTSYSSTLENKLLDKQRAIESAADALKRQTESLNKQQEALRQSGIDTDNLAEESRRLSEEMDTLSEETEEAAKEVDKYRNAGTSAFEAVGAALVSSGISQGLKQITDAYKECVSIAGTFQSTMSTVEALSGANAYEMEMLSEKAKELGATTQYTATQSAEAMTYMGMAGWSAEQMLSGMNGVLSLAAASGEDLAMVSDIVTDSLTAFGMTANDTAYFADVLAATATGSNTSVAMMGETFKNAAPLAGTLGYSIEDVSVAIGLMANNFVKGSSAGTALKNMFTGLVQGVTLTSEAFGEVEFSAARSDGTMKSFSETMEELRGYFSQMNDEEQIMNAELITGKYGLAALSAVMNTTEEDYNKLTNNIRNCSGEAQKMAEIRMDNLQGQITLMNSAMDALKTTVGEAYEDELKDLAKVATELLTDVNVFLKNNPLILKGIIAIAGVAATTLDLYLKYMVAKKAMTALKAAYAALTAKETATEMAHAGAVALSALKYAGLVAAIAAVTAEFAYYGNVIWGVSDKVRDLQDETQGITDRISSSMAQHEAEMSILRDKVELYDHLRNKQYLSAEQQKQLKEIAGELQEVFGDEVEVVNSLTGEYNDLSGALENYVENQTKRIRMSSLEQAATEAYAQIDKINSEMEDRMREHAEWDYWGSLIDKKGNVQWGNLTDFVGNKETYVWLNDMEAYREEIKKCEAIIAEYQNAKRAEIETTDEEAEAARLLTGVSNELYHAILAVESGYCDAASAADTYGVSADDLQEALKSVNSYQYQLNNAIMTVKTGFRTAVEAAEQYGLTAEGIEVYSSVQTSINSIAELTTAYGEALAAAEKSIEGQYKLWDDAAMIVAQDIDAINSSLMSQSDYWKEYEANIAALSDKANDIESLRDIIATFADGSPDSANMIAGLAQSSDEDLKRMVENWKSVQEEQRLTSEALAELTTGAGKNITELQEELDKAVEALNIEDEAEAAAKDSIDAYVQALKNGEADAVAAAERISSLVAAALNPNTQVITLPDGTELSTMNIPSIEELQAQAEFVGPIQPTLHTSESGATYSGGGRHRYASGTDGAEPGLALVGENGPELVVLAGGEQIFTAEQTRNILQEIKAYALHKKEFEAFSEHRKEFESFEQHSKEIKAVNEYAAGTGAQWYIQPVAAADNENTQHSAAFSPVTMSPDNIMPDEVQMYALIPELMKQYNEYVAEMSGYSISEKDGNGVISYREPLEAMPFSASSGSTPININLNINVETTGDNADIAAALEERLRTILPEIINDTIEENEMDRRRRVYK